MPDENIKNQNAKIKNNEFTEVTEKKTQMPEIEMRVLAFDNTELRLDDDKPMLVGYAARYNSFTDLGWFREKIKPGAFDEVLADDVRCLKNHDPNLILGRLKNGTLRLSSNSVGLKFENDVPDTTTGRDTREEVRRGDISGCSFAFTVKEDDWRYFDDKPAERTIVKLGRLFDVGPVTYPVYQDTSVAARSLAEFRSKNISAAENTESTEKKEEKIVETKSDLPGKDEVTSEEMRQLRAGYRTANQILHRLKQADACQK